MRCSHLAPIVIVLVSLVWPLAFTHASDDGRYAKFALKPWFDSLRSGKGPCCSDADGYSLADVDWESIDGHYRVRIPRSNDAVDKNVLIKQTGSGSRESECQPDACSS